MYLNHPPIIRWCLIHTKSRSEIIARDNLERQGYEVYLPMTYCDSRVKDRKVEPLFPGYQFLRVVDGETDIHPVKHTLGVLRPVTFGGVLAYVPNSLISELRYREDSEGLHGVSQEYQTGERVRVIKGPFAEYYAVIQARKGQDRVILLLEIVQREIEMRTALIEPVEDYERLRRGIHS